MTVKNNNYLSINTKKDIFKGLKTKKELQKEVFNYIKNGNDNFIAIKDIIDDKVVRFIRKSADEYVYGSNSKKLNNKEYEQKMRIAPSIDDLINNASIKYCSPLIHNNKLFPNGFNNYQGIIKIDENLFRYIVRIGKGKKDSIFYDVTIESIDK